MFSQLTRLTRLYHWGGRLKNTVPIPPKLTVFQKIQKERHKKIFDKHLKLKEKERLRKTKKNI